MYDNVSEKQHSLWLMAALAAPLTQAASNCSWLAALVVAALCGVIALGLEKASVGGTPGRWTGAVQWLWMLLVMSEFLHWSMLCWPQHRSYYVVPLTLLLLAAYDASRGTQKAAACAGALFWILALLLGAVIVSGIPEIKIENLKPEWGMQTAHLITVLLIPTMGSGLSGGKRKLKLVAFTVILSAVTTGVLSLKLIRQMEAPFYEMSRSLRLLGLGQRFESLVAAGMTLGYFALMSYLLTISANAWEMGKRHCRSVWISAAFTALVFISGMRLNSRLLAMGTLTVWVILPLTQKIIKIMKKPIDK